MRTNGTWHADALATDSGAPTASGALVAYLHQNAVHVISRAGNDGHLVDLYRSGTSAKADDLTATADDGTGHAPPAATYRAATYTPTGRAPRIAYRALRGGIWIIERDTLQARNLGALAIAASGSTAGMAGAPLAAGSPTALGGDTSRVFYRTVDGLIIEIFDDGGTVKWREICGGAAADPTAFVDAEGPKVSFRSEDGSIRLAKLLGGIWICDFATRTWLPDVGTDSTTSDIPVIPV